MISYEDFVKKLQNKMEPISTGLNQLDELLEGGVRNGLHFLGAVPSLGKTTFCLQLARQFSQTHKVNYYCLEQPSEVLISKLIAPDLGVSPREIEKRFKNNCDFNFQANVKRLFDTIGKNLTFIERDCDKEPITAERVAREAEEADIIFIDYLQIMKSEGNTAKDKMDYLVDKLATTAQKLRKPFIIISSLNRESYKDDLTMAAFKESGIIEYGADVLIGLQFKDKKNEAEAREKNPREIELLLMKNKEGRTGRINLLFYPKKGEFVEVISNEIR